MSDLWAYRPEVCDGDICPMNCDYCPKRHPTEEEEDDDE